MTGHRPSGTWRDGDAPRPGRPRGTRVTISPAPARARSRARRTVGNCSVIENGPGGAPNSASCRSGSSAASSSAVGSSASSAYGQKRSSGRVVGVSATGDGPACGTGRLGHGGWMKARAAIATATARWYPDRSPARKHDGLSRHSFHRSASAAARRVPAGGALRPRRDGRGPARGRRRDARGDGRRRLAARIGRRRPPRDWNVTRPPGWPRRIARRCGRVLNATGVIIHTNLGRAPLAEPRHRRASRGSAAVTRTSSTTWRRARAARATSTPKRCCAGSPAPKRRSSSTTARRRRCWCWRRWRAGARCSSRAASSWRLAAASACRT